MLRLLLNIAQPIFFVTVLSHGLWELTMAEPHEEGYVQQLKGTA